MIRVLPWWAAGIAMSLLLLFTFSIFGANRPLGCSTTVSYLSSELFGLQEYVYSQKIRDSGAWELVLLLGSIVGGFFTSIFITKSFGVKFLPSLWKERKNNSILSRFIWSFLGGFLIVFGARLAGGCTSGHVLSGISQTAVSGLVFILFMMISLLITGHLFYKKGAK
jgi:uncharacterized membrane protein YedE/YeeE